MNCSEACSRVNAYMDGELDLLRALAVEAHLFACTACRKLHAQHTAARTLLRAHATCFPAPPALRTHVRCLTATANRRPAAQSWRSRVLALASAWPAFGAALAFAVTATWTLSAQFLAEAAADRLPQEIVSSHVRALMSARQADIVSADPGNIRPWLNAKLAYSPRVDDLAPDGYTLVGGRVDYVREQRVAAVVYRHLGHSIDVFTWPATRHDVPARSLSRKGYNLVNWTYDGMFFCAVSDLDHAQLATLARLLQRPPVSTIDASCHEEYF
jgi:anti-sigma factor RsiW